MFQTNVGCTDGICIRLAQLGRFSCSVFAQFTQVGVDEYVFYGSH